MGTSTSPFFDHSLPTTGGELSEQKISDVNTNALDCSSSKNSDDSIDFETFEKALKNKFGKNITDEDIKTLWIKFRASTAPIEDAAHSVRNFFPLCENDGATAPKNGSDKAPVATSDIIANSEQNTEQENGKVIDSSTRGEHSENTIGAIRGPHLKADEVNITLASNDAFKAAELASKTSKEMDESVYLQDIMVERQRREERERLESLRKQEENERILREIDRRKAHSVNFPNYEYQSRKRSASSPNPESLSRTVKSRQSLSKSARKRGNEISRLINSDSILDDDEGGESWKKYIGTLNISCWCTRSVFSLNNIYVNNTLVLTTSPGSGVVYVSHKTESSQFKRELGRLNEEFADLIRPLLDSNAMEFESKLFFVDGQRLSTGDTFVIRTDCFLSGRLFENEDVVNPQDDDLELDQMMIMKNAHGNIDSGTVLKGAILKMFHKIGLRTVREDEMYKKKITVIDLDTPENEVSTITELAYADDSEIIENGNIAADTTNGESSRLTLDQVKDIYKSTELNNLQQNLPESIPDDFKVALRPYQKLGLSWMLQREKEYDMVGLNNDSVDQETKQEVILQLKNYENSVNPLWKEYTWPMVPERLQNEGLPPNCSDSFYLNMYKGKCSMVKPILRSNCKGGILADEMGLGKTITTLSLVLSCPKDLEYDILPDDHIDKIKGYAPCTTLIVLPMALLTQWEREFMKVSTNPEHKCFIYYGSGSLGDLKSLLCGPNPPTVVLTTYGMIQSEYSRTDLSKGSGLFSVSFFRVILDEGHNIRNRTTKTAKAIYSLKADRKWILTGTPIINRLEDLFSLVHFLGMKPWSYHSLWKQCISAPFETGREVDVAIELLKSILDPILLRRTKNQKDANGKYLVELPPKEVTIQKLTFNKREEAIYNWLKEKAVNSFNENFRSGMLFKNYSTILTQLLRLRQVCCHIDLIKAIETDADDHFGSNEVKTASVQQKWGSEGDDEMQSLVKTIELNEEQQRIPIEDINKLKETIYEHYPSFDDIECSICTEVVNVETCIITECKHCFCLGCLTEHFEFQLKHDKEEASTEGGQPLNNEQTMHDRLLQAEEVFCPMCRTQINRNRLFRTVKKNAKATDTMNVDTDDAFLTQKAANSSPAEREYYIRPFVPNEQSSKINALLIHLEQVKQEAPGEHVIVFSQFTSFLDIIETELLKYNGEFQVCKFDGRLNLEQRQKVLAEFEKPVPEGDNKISVLLLSLKAGGVGLNLTVANRAFLMDPHWNNAIEFQAIDRIHRVGQRKHVKVVRFIIGGSIEDRMLDIQERKNQLGEALNISDEERRRRKVAELQSLLKE